MTKTVTLARGELDRGTYKVESFLRTVAAHLCGDANSVSEAPGEAIDGTLYYIGAGYYRLLVTENRRVFLINPGMDTPTVHKVAAAINTIIHPYTIYLDPIL